MTDTLIDHADSGEIPRPVGETTRIITAAERERLIGERTENLGQYFRPDAPFMTTVRAAAGDRVGRETTDYPTIGVLPELGSEQPTLVYGERVIDIEDTVVHHVDELDGPQAPPPPLPPVPDEHDVFGGLGADLPEPDEDGDDIVFRRGCSVTDPGDAPAGSRVVCRRNVRAAFRRGVLIGAGAALAVYSGLVLAALVVVR